MPFNKQYFEKNFLETYNKLNIEQRAAVDRIEGPVMVVAGPGTGKTQILSARIGKILLDTDAQPQNILCLTYTDAGVLAMRKRLLSMIGPEAYNINLHSYHSFCNMVIQQNMHLFHKKELQPISDLEQTQALVKLIDSFSNDNPLKRYKTDAYYEAPNFKNLFSAIKREGWTIEFLTSKVDDYIANNIPAEFANKIKLKKGIVELTQAGKNEIEKMERLKAAVAAFPAYQQILKDAHRYDFDDMINWVITVFDNNPDVLLTYQEQFLYLLVDEYQDTSGSQNRLVQQLINYDESPNVFVVGDDDQSIYRFQGANLENMMLLSKQYKDILRVVLTQNYRSVQPILNAAQNLIQNNTQRLTNEYDDINKILNAASERHIGINTLPEIVTVNNEFEENIYVAEEIKKLVHDEKTDPGKIAVIYKEHKTGDELQKFLQLQQVPYYAKRSINLLHDFFIKKIITYLKYIDAETQLAYSGEPYLFEILHFDFYKIPALKTAEISNEVATNNRKNTAPQTLRAYLSNLATTHSGKLFSDDAITNELVHIHQNLEKLIKENKNNTLLNFITQLINEAGILSYVMQQNDKAYYMQLLNAFFDYIKDEARRNPDITLAQLLTQIDLQEQNKIPVPLVQTSGADTGVNLLTCHGSKGLEYEHVFFVGCYSSLWEGKRANNQGFKLPKNIFDKESAEEKEEELRRLFFVAATRAEKHLHISYPLYTNEGKALEMSRFIAEMNSDAAIEIKQYPVADELKLKYSALRYGMLQQPVMEEADKEYVNNLLQNFKLNVSALNSYLDCPLKFYYNTLVRVPGTYSESAQFGSSMHHGLATYYNKMMEDNARQYPARKILINSFLLDIHNNRQAFTKESLQRFKDYGVQCLTALYETKFKQANAGDFIRTEVPLNATVNGIPMKGFADAVQYWGNDIVITDFKTGSLEKANRRFEFVEPGHEKKPEGGNYWRQAAFYKLLNDNKPDKPKNLLQIEFMFVEPNKKGIFDTHTVSVSPQNEAILVAQITDTWQKIQSHDFYTGCGKPDCEWCGFVKQHKLYKNLIEVEAEDEEALM